MQALEDSWRRVTGKPLPATVRGYVEAVAKQLPPEGSSKKEAPAARSLVRKIAGWLRR